MLLNLRCSLVVITSVFLNTALAQAQNVDQGLRVTQLESTNNYDLNTLHTTVGSTDENQKGRFGVTYYFLGGQTYLNNNRYTNVDIYDSYISFNYKVNHSLRFSVRPAFGYSVANTGKNKYGEEVTNQSRNRDLSFVMTNYDVLDDYLPEELSYKIQFRYYVPTSDQSKEQNMIGRLQMENEIRQSFMRFSNVRYYVKPSYFFQRNTTYLSNSNPKYPNDQAATTQADSEQGVEVTFSLSKMFGLKPGVNFKDQWWNKSEYVENPNASYHKSVVDYRFGLEVNPMKLFGFTFGVQYEQDLIQTDKPKEWSYSILASGTLY